MTDKPVGTPGVQSKMIAESDFLAFKEGSLGRERRLKAELVTVKKELGIAQSELKVAKMNGEDDEEVAKVKAYLVAEAKKVEAQRAELDADLASKQERDKEAKTQALVTKYGVDIESISGEDDPEKKALELYAERLTKEVGELKRSAQVFETGSVGMTKKQPKDMDEKEFDTHTKQLREKALSGK